MTGMTPNTMKYIQDLEVSQLMYVYLYMTGTTHLTDQNNRSRCIFRHDQYFTFATGHRDVRYYMSNCLVKCK